MKTFTYLLFFYLLVGSLCLQAKFKNTNDCKPFTLTLKVNNLDTGQIRIMYATCNDSSAAYVADIKNGVAKFSGFINQATEALVITDLSAKHYSLDGPKVIRLILEPKQMHLYYSVNSIGAYDVIINGSSSQIEYEEWRKENIFNLDLQQTISAKFNPSLLPKERALIKLELDSVYRIILQQVKNYVSTHKDSYTSAYLLSQYNRRLPIDTLKSYYSQLTEHAQQSEIGEQLLEDILTLSSKDDAFVSKYGSKNLSNQLKSAKNFLDFTLVDLDNNSIDLKIFKGKYTFVNIWASWCAPCIKNLPDYEKLKTNYKNQPINFVSISIDTKPGQWKKSVQQNKLSGVSLIDADGILKSFYEIQGVPIYMIINPDGSMAELDVPKPGTAQLNKILEKYISKSKLKLEETTVNTK